MYIFSNYSTQTVQCQVEMLNLGKKLRELRRAENLTQEQLSAKLNISRVNYTRYETGAVRPDYETVILLADFYEISLDELFDRKQK